VRWCVYNTIRADKHVSLIAQKARIVPIPGTTNLSRLEENIGAVAVELTPGDLQEIETATS
jgi:aryl-alcohol dehydrogenase-like predicted oxidoreductase